jgi:branched-chain amino acid transport system substrate-binding protein
MAVGGYDGMRVIYKALEATKGAGGEALLNAMKGQIFESPRGRALGRPGGGPRVPDPTFQAAC